MEHAHKLLSGKTDYLHEPDHVHTRARTHTPCPGWGGWTTDNKKAPKGQKHNLKGSSLFFCKERKSRKKKGREVSRFGPRAGNPKKTPAKPQENGGDSEVL